MNLIESYRTLKEYRSDPLAFIKKNFQQNGHFTHLNIFGKNLYIISKPEDVVHVLKTNHAAYSKGRTTKALQKFLGKGLITNDDMDNWRKQHRLIRPTMNIKSIYELAPKIFETTQEFMPELIKTPEVNGFHEMNRLTWRIILKTLFSQEVTQEMDDWLSDILELMEMITNKTRATVPVPFWMPTAKNLAMKRILSKFDAYVYELIRQRRHGQKKHDLIQLLIDAQEDGLSNMTDLEIRDEVMTFLMAGHETITNSMSWLLIEVSKNKDATPHMQNEAREFFEHRDFERLNNSPWLTACIDESMRMWPPVWVFMRQAETEDTISGVKIPVGANVVLGTYLSHHAPDLWDEPHLFKPTRFMDKKKITAGAYYPFGLGPRACIGAYFAGVEAKIILASIVHHYDWDISKVAPQTSTAGITLRPSNNVMMKFRRR
ncbi:MAG TPA: cytochrome P450 [Bacteriovoracaceae bacterium]|nr:cytochrome P450 [Bacteriovoracaceae bacterium]